MTEFDGQDEIVKEFLVESYENLDQLDQDLIALEQDPGNREILASIFRTIHTIKGTCGFLGFDKLEKVAHVGENLLSRLRDGELVLDQERTSALLTMIDAIRQILSCIEADGQEGDVDYSALIAELERLQQIDASAAAAPAAESGEEAPAAEEQAEPAPQSAEPVVVQRELENFGDILLESGQIDGDQLDAAVTEQVKGDPRRIGEILVDQGAIDGSAVKDTLKTQAEQRGGSLSESTIRVDVEHLDKLMNLVGELVLARNQILQHTTGIDDSAFVATSQRLNLITTELQEGVMKTRMQPIGNVWSKLPRVVRDLATSFEKEIDLVMEGKETELDKTIIEAIRDPLTHLVRNSVDHGIEPPEVREAKGKPREGTLLLRAFHEGGQVNIEIVDDGGGIDVERVKQKAISNGVITNDQANRMSEHELCNLVFMAGLSTATHVTNVSGRGVGMDVVRTNIEKIGGTIDLSSQPGEGTTFRIKIPLTLAIIPALIVTTGSDRYAIPQVSLLELVRLEGEQVLSGLDVFARAGADTALDYTFEEIAVSDGVLDIEFVKEVEFPCVAAIAVTGAQGEWKVNCGGGAYEDYAADAGAGLVPAEQRRELYRGMFERIQRTHPLDYYWLWTPEGWTWQDVAEGEVERTVEDINAAYAALKETNAPFGLATCGWVLGPQYNRAYLDEVLPKDIGMSCINRQVGHDPVESGFAEVEGRPQWAIPWLEDDPAMTSIQLWAGRMRRDAQDALEYGCTGLMGIHWRTRILAPNVSALARAAWDQSGWPEPEQTEKGETPRHLPARDFYADWAAHEFGLEAGIKAAEILARVDGALPRPSDWVGGPGGYTPDPTPWDEVQAAYAFIDEFAALRPEVKGKANLERFDYWLHNLEFLRATGKMRCDWHAFNIALEAAEKAESPEKKVQRARQRALPARIQLVETVATAFRHLLATVTTTGAMGTVTNLEQHTFPGMLNKPAEKLEGLLNEPLPEDAFLPGHYSGAPRLVVTTQRASVEEDEALPLTAALLDTAPPRKATVFWRPLGMGEFQELPMRIAARNTCRATLTRENLDGRDIEYYIEAETADGETLRWPASAPETNQSVVCLEGQ